MRKFVGKVVVFSFLFGLLNLGYLGLCMKLDWNFSKRIDALNLKQPTYRNIVIGNSLAMDGIDCRQLFSDPNDSYNLAIGGASLRTNYIQLNEYLDIALEKPEVVILPVGSFRKNFFGNKSIHPIVEFTMADYNFKLNDLPLVKFKWIFTELLKKLFSREHQTAKLVQGQLRIKKTVPDNTKIAVPGKDIPVNKYRESEYLRKILNLCNTNEIQLILIEIAGFRNTRNSQPIGPYEIRFDQNNFVKLYNFNGPEIDSIIDPRLHWLGGSHLNETGAREFTKYLSHCLQQLSFSRTSPQSLFLVEANSTFYK